MVLALAALAVGVFFTVRAVQTQGKVATALFSDSLALDAGYETDGESERLQGIADSLQLGAWVAFGLSPVLFGVWWVVHEN